MPATFKSKDRNMHNSPPPEAPRLDEHAFIPADLKTRPQWGGWRSEQAEPKPKKMPINPHTGMYASSTDATTWGTFAEACAARDRVELDGIGFALTPHDRYAFIDLDHCVDPSTGAIEPWAEQLVSRFNSYTEISPSGTGLHILIQGELPNSGKGRHRGPIEIYDRARFCTVTGNFYKPVDPCDRQAELEQLYLAAKPLATALTKYGDKFSLLFAGRREAVINTKGIPYESQSEADMAFATMLAQVGATKEQIDAAMRLSGLYREKWDRSDYQNDTISTALRGFSIHRGVTAIVMTRTSYAMVRTTSGTLRPSRPFMAIGFSIARRWVG